ncbi:MAG: protein BatD [Elusimicrobia bacterium]|nr:protein BatD [Elusimicrobiota bacterium]
MSRFAFLAVLLAAVPAAAGVTVSAELSRAQIRMGDQLTLAVTVSGDQASLPAPRLPPIEAFNVYDSGRSQSLSFVNGHVSSNVVYTYALSPRAAGHFKIPPVSADGAAVPSAPLDVEVLPAGAAAPAAPPTAGQPAPDRADDAPRRGRSSDIFVTASLDKPRVYVNQQVTLTIRFLNAVQLIGDLNYSAPDLTGFLTEELPPVRSGSVVIGGRPYDYREIKIALFPVQAGRLKIGAASIHCSVPHLGSANLQDFFDRFMAMSAPEPVVVNTEPLTLQVDPMPAGKPEDFTGVVGRLAARVTADRTDVKAGDAVTLSVAVTGTGNMKSIPEPRKPDLPALRFFETETSAAVAKTNDRVGGTKTFRTVVVPRVSGRVRVPPFSFSYFDPETKSYARAETAPVDLNVAPGPAGAAAPAAPVRSTPGLTDFGDDIRYLKIAPSSSGLTGALAAFAGLGPWHAFPFALFLTAALIAWRRSAADADPRGRRFREALARAETRLKEASALPADQAARAAALIDEAVAGFVADKLGAPAAGLTLKAALDGLAALPRRPAPETLERLRAAWDEANLRRFAPGAAGGDLSRFAQDASDLLKRIDEETRR